MDDLDRLHDRLVTNIHEGFPHLLERNFRLGDITEHLVPYRTNRPALRFDSARQYELALMRLASGERGYLRVEPTVADAFRRALAAPDPDAAVLRDHALATVALTNGGAVPPQATAPQTAVPIAPTATATYEVPAPVISPMPSPLAVAVPPPEAASGGWPSYDAPSLDPAWPPAGAAEPAPPPPAPPPPPVEPARTSAPVTPPGPTAIGGPCRYCGQGLPEGRLVTYCPHCGQNVTVRHCPACSTELEVGWRYCITCGRAMDEGSLHAGGR